MGKAKASSVAKQGPAWSGKQGGKSKLVVVDEQSSSTDSNAATPSRSAEKRRKRAERKAARKREGEGEQPVLVQVEVPQRLLESISTLENRVRTLEANAGSSASSSVPPPHAVPPVAVPRAHESTRPAGHLQGARSQSLYDTSRAGGVSGSSEHRRTRSLPRSSVQAYSFFNPDRTSMPSSQGPSAGTDSQEWRKRTVVLSGFETRRTIQEFKAIAGTQLRIPEGAKLLTRSKFASVCSIELETPVQAKSLIEDFKASARIVDQRRVYANPSLPPAAARRGWMLRAARRSLLAYDDQLALSVCTRSDTLFVKRDEVFYIRGDKAYFTDKWPAEVCKAELLALFRTPPQGGFQSVLVPARWLTLCILVAGGRYRALSHGTLGLYIIVIVMLPRPSCASASSCFRAQTFLWYRRHIVILT
eukprot:200354-Amphidinium_carterae.4